MDFKDLVNRFNSEKFIDPAKWRILHLQYNPDGSKIAFRLDVVPKKEKFNHLITDALPKSGRLKPKMK